MNKSILIDKDKNKNNKNTHFSKKLAIEIYFEMMHMLLSHCSSSIETISFVVLIELCQMLSFSFHYKLEPIWKLGEVYHNFSNFFSYFLLSNFIRGSFAYYTIVYVLCLLMIIITQGLMLYIALRLYHNHSISLMVIQITKRFTQAISSIFYLPIIKILLGGFEYEDGANIFKIDNTSSLYVFCSIGILFTFLLSLLSLYSKMTLFHTHFNKIEQGAKHTSSYERFVLLTKLLLTIVFYLNFAPWMMAIVLFFLSGYLIQFYLVRLPDYSPFLRKVKIISSMIFFWSAIILLIGVIFRGSIFNGCMPLMLIGAIIFTITFVIYKDRNTFILYQSIALLQKSTHVFNHIRTFITLISDKNSKRDSKILISGYVDKFEQSANNIHCPLKKYKEASEKKHIATSYLYQHTESLFQTAISKFPNYVLLRIGYSMILNDFLNKKQSALKEINNAKRFHPSFEERFVIYRYEHEYTDFNHRVSLGNSDIDAFSALAYKNSFAMYKNAFLKISLLYVEFWSMLLNKNEDQEQLAKLYRIGNKINKLTEDIKALFDKLQKINMNDEEVLFYYIEFCYNILNDEDQGLNLKKKLDMIQEEKEDNEEVSLNTFNINSLTTSDKFQFILLSSKQGLSCIINISLTICILLGYTKEELVGKPLDKLIPELLQKEHKKMLYNHLRQYKEESNHKNDMNEENQKKLLKKIEVFAVNKAKYLVQMNMNTAIIPTETQGNQFIAQVNLMPGGYNPYINKANNICYILTNNNFIIQNFTVNAMNLLGLKSSVLNGQVELTSYIKQFHEDFLSQAVSNEDITLEQKMTIKRNIINSKYRNPIVINWKVANEVESVRKSIKVFQTIVNESFIFDQDKRVKLQGSNELFYITIIDAAIRDKQEGYYFRLELCNSKNKPSTEINNKRNTMNFYPSRNKLSSNSYQQTCYHSNKNLIAVDNQFDIDNLPQEQNKINFQINLKAMCFEVNKNQSNSLLDKLRKQALKKIDIYNKETKNSKTNMNEELENEEDEEDEDSDDNCNSVIYHSSESSDSKHRKPSSNASHSNKCSSSITLTKSKGTTEDYYKVDLSYIKYSTYNYEKSMFIEIKDYDKRSQVEIQKNKTITSKEKLELTDDQIIKSDNRINYDNQNKEISSIDLNILTQKIKYSLKGEEHQPTIIRFKIVSFFFFIILLFDAIAWICGFFEAFSILKLNFNYIESSVYINYLQLKGMINVRSLVLINDPNYSNFFYSRDKDKELLINDSNATYFFIHEIIRFLIFSESNISSKEHLMYLRNTTILCREIMDHALEMNTFNHTVFSAMNQVNTALFHIITQDISRTPLNNIVYFYLQNSHNEISLAQRTLIDIFNKEFEYKIIKCRNIQIVLLLGFVPLYIICFFSMVYVYNAVTKRKETYLTVFFEIKNNIIMDSLEKCERFAKQIQTDNLIDYINAEEDDIVSTCSYKRNLTNTNTEVNPNANSNNSNLNASNTNRDSKPSRINNSKEQLTVKIIIAMMILICFGIGIIFYCLYDQFQTMISKQINAYSNQILMELEFLYLFNSLSEYLFDSKRYVNFRQSKDNFDSAIKPFYYYNLAPKKQIVLNAILDFPADYANLFEKIYYGNVCLYAEFPPDLDCASFLYSSTIDGLEIVSSAFFDEILEAKHQQLFLDIYQEKENFKYNLSLTGSDYEKDLIPKNESLLDSYKLMHQIEIFNLPTYQTLIRTYWFILRPCFDLLIAQFSKTILNLFAQYKIMFLGLSFSYAGLLVILYIILWKPYERGLNNMIFKTKNMLLIIPVNILVTLHNIQSLLG